MRLTPPLLLQPGLHAKGKGETRTQERNIGPHSHTLLLCSHFCTGAGNSKKGKANEGGHKEECRRDIGVLTGLWCRFEWVTAVLKEMVPTK